MRIFKHACVRDLAWAGFSPLLINALPGQTSCPLTREFWRDHLRALDEDPAQLLAFLGDRRSPRLGLYFESLWHYLLENDPGIDLLGHNIPVRDGGRTLGEFDCLYLCRRSQRHVHLELAVKFYLGVPGTDIWLGPGRRDRLDRKLKHLLEHQSQLTRHPAAAATLSELGIKNCESRIALRGYLFAPESGMPPPESHNPGNAVQRWFTLDSFTLQPELPAEWVGWQKIPRQHWLSPWLLQGSAAVAHDDLLARLRERLTTTGRPAQLAACDAAGAERYRCFVTAEKWPHDRQKKPATGAG